ncbi:hypothetical protein [Microlunatus sp. GCM10028923]|uniref:hypothetical protein n=1 Tax=Microlunatus sp. GCM10028923 TaxID=3273400 RepID=UPI003612B637
MNWRDATTADLLRWHPGRTRRTSARPNGRVAVLVDWLGRPARVAALNGMIILAGLAVVTWPAAMAAAIAADRGDTGRLWSRYWIAFGRCLRSGLVASAVLLPVLGVIGLNLWFLAGRPGVAAAALWLLNLSFLGLWWCLAAATARSIAARPDARLVARLRPIMVDLLARPSRSATTALLGLAVAALIISAPLLGSCFAAGLTAVAWSRLGGLPTDEGETHADR